MRMSELLAEYGKLEADNKKLKNQKEYVYKPEIKQLQAENKRLREALEKLSRLGNEPHLGNSDGNRIAQQALKQE